MGSAPSARYLPGRLAGDPVSSWRHSYLASAADGDGDGDGSCHCPVSLAAAARCSRRPRSCASPPAILLFVRLCSAIAVPFFRLAIRTRVWPVSPVQYLQHPATADPASSAHKTPTRAGRRASHAPRRPSARACPLPGCGRVSRKRGCWACWRAEEVERGRRCVLRTRHPPGHVIGEIYRA
jgi:hypothetical protein